MKCKNHPQVDTDEVCNECGNAFCDDCLLEIRGKNVCEYCANEIINNYGDEKEKKEQREKEKAEEERLKKIEQQQKVTAAAAARPKPSCLGCGCGTFLLLCAIIIAAATIISLIT